MTREEFKLKDIKDFIFDMQFNCYKWEYQHCQLRAIEYLEYLLNRENCEDEAIESKHRSDDYKEETT